MNPAYAYIYDDFLNDKRYQDILAVMESKLAAMGLSGHIGRLTLFRGPKALIENFVRQGATNIVIVGNDVTLNKVMWFVPDLPVTIGYIPLAEPAHIADILNVPPGLAACDILGARLIETLDVGRIGDRYFLNEVVFKNSDGKLEVEGSYKLGLISDGTFSIRNLGFVSKDQETMSDPKDGLLEAVFLPTQSGGFFLKFWKKSRAEKQRQTRVFFKKGMVMAEKQIEGRADLNAINGDRFDVNIIPQKLRIITGRNRKMK